MPRIKFLKDFDYKPVPQQVFAYKKGDVVLVTQEVADKAIAQRKAELTDFPAPPSGIKKTIEKFPNRKIKRVSNGDGDVEKIKEEQGMAELLEIAAVDEEV